VDNPCKECIVNAMCLKSCIQLEDYLISSVPSPVYYHLNHRNTQIILHFMRVSALSDKVIEVRVCLAYFHRSNEDSQYILLIVKKGDIVSVDNDYKFDEDVPSEQPIRDRGQRIETYIYKDHGLRIEFIYRGGWGDILPNSMLGPTI